MHIPAASGGMVLFGQSRGRLFLMWSRCRGLGCVVHLCRAGAAVSLGSTLWSPPGRPVQALLPGAEPGVLSVLGVSLQPCGVSGGPTRGDCGARPGQCLSDLTSKTFLLERQEWMLG